jgi:hypothetical protein
MNIKTTAKRNSIFAIFKEEKALERALTILRSQNFRNADISILLEKTNKSPEAATAGAASGALAGSIFGWLIGAGTIAISGLGAFIVAGPIMSAIAGAGIAGTFGGIAGGLIGLGITEYEALEYEEKIKAGGILISIHIDDDIWEKKAVEILLENGASHIASTLSSKSSEEYSFYDEIKIEHEFDEKRNNPHA